MTGSRSEIDRRLLPVDDPMRRCPDIGRVRDLLGWQPCVPLETRPKNALAWRDGPLSETEESSAMLLPGVSTKPLA